MRYYALSIIAFAPWLVSPCFPADLGPPIKAADEAAKFDDDKSKAVPAVQPENPGEATEFDTLLKSASAQVREEYRALFADHELAKDREEPSVQHSVRTLLTDAKNRHTFIVGACGGEEEVNKVFAEFDRRNIALHNVALEFDLVQLAPILRRYHNWFKLSGYLGATETTYSLADYMHREDTPKSANPFTNSTLTEMRSEVVRTHNIAESARAAFKKLNAIVKIHQNRLDTIAAEKQAAEEAIKQNVPEYSQVLVSPGYYDSLGNYHYARYSTVVRSDLIQKKRKALEKEAEPERVALAAAKHDADAAKLSLNDAETAEAQSQQAFEAAGGREEIMKEHVQAAKESAKRSLKNATVYTLKNGKSITALQCVDGGDVLTLKDDSGNFITVKKSEIAETIPPGDK